MASQFEIYPRGGSDTWDQGLAGELLSAEFFGSATVTGRVKVFLSSVFQAKPVKVFLGGLWVTKPAKRYNGTNWITTTY